MVWSAESLTVRSTDDEDDAIRIAWRDLERLEVGRRNTRGKTALKWGIVGGVVSVLVGLASSEAGMIGGTATALGAMSYGLGGDSSRGGWDPIYCDEAPLEP